MSAESPELRAVLGFAEAWIVSEPDPKTAELRADLGLAESQMVFVIDLETAELRTEMRLALPARESQEPLHLCCQESAQWRIPGTSCQILRMVPLCM